MKVRAARPTDLPTILQWRRDTAEWLAESGSDQWSDQHNTDLFDLRVEQSVAAGETWIAEDDDRAPLGAIAIDTRPDTDLWTPTELEAAYVLHRMIVARSAVGRGVGAALIDHAEQLARQHGRTSLLLDAWTSNTRLHDYPCAQGFRYVRTVAGHPTPSAALFARPVRTTLSTPTTGGHVASHGSSACRVPRYG